MNANNETETIPGLPLDRYRKKINLDDPFEANPDLILSAAEKDRIIGELLDVLINTEHLTSVEQIPADYDGKRQFLRALMNIRPPHPISDMFLASLDRLLQDEANRKDYTGLESVPPVSEMIPANRVKNAKKMILWKGDIPRLLADAIVNAANNQMLGCFQPLHNCIDNIIHTAAGPRVREDCQAIMDITQRPEATGDAKITRAYNLRSKYILHTVGPIIRQLPVSDRQNRQLASCYQSCLSLAAQVSNIRSIAFPCISTGVFNFPRNQAAGVAITAVDSWLEANPDRFDRIVFNVFLQEDFDEYISAFQQ